MVQHYRQLIAGQKAMAMVTDAYRFTRSFPPEELYGLTSQLRRSAVSVPSDIAEGQGRRTWGEFVQFLGHAYGSLLELETQITLAHDLGYVDADNTQALLTQADEVGRIINGLISSLSSDH